MSIKPAKRKSRVVRLLDIIIFFATIIFAAGLVCAYFAKRIHPENSWVFAFTGLTAPILYILNLIMLLFWAIRWKWVVAIPGITLLLGAGYISLFFRPSVSKHYDDGPTGSITVMSYNVAGFLHRDESGAKVSSLDSVASFIRNYNPDILCLQEFQSRSAEYKKTVDSLLNMKYSRVNYSLPFTKNEGGWGVAVYSNYPIISTGSINFPNSNNSSIWVDAVIKKDTVRIFNCHLQTTSVSESERDYISNQEFIHDAGYREEKVRGIASKLKRNYVTRAEQADSIAPIIHSSPYKLFVCGDFNDTPMSYVYHKIRGNLLDTFAEKGQGFNSHTFRGLFNIFRIDYILHSPEIKALHYSTPDSEYSDHKAVVAGFSLTDR